MKKLLLASTTVGLLAASQFATNAEAAPQTQSQLQEGVHIIQWGDTLNKISEKYDVTVDQLKKWNNLESDVIYAGEKLYVTEAAAAAHGYATSSDFIVPTSNNNQAYASYNHFAYSVEPTSYNQSYTTVTPAASTSTNTYTTYEAPVTQSASNTNTTVTTKTTSNYQAPTTTKATSNYQAPTTAGSGSVYEQFINAGGSAAMWNAIVLPESGGNPNIVSPNGYRGLGQTKEAWGTGSVATQTQGMLNYANARYGSVERAIQFRQANGWW